MLPARTAPELPPLPILVAVGAVLVVLVALAARRGLATVAYTLALLVAATLPLNDLRAASWVTVADVLVVGAFGAALPIALRRGRSLDLPPAFLVGLAVFMAAATIGSLGTHEPLDSLVNFLRLAVTICGPAIALALWRPGAAELRPLVWAWLAGNSASVALGVRSVAHQTYDGRAQGLTTHPNALGLLCALSLALAVFLWESGGRWSKAYAAVTAGIAGVGLIESGSRAALLAGVAVALGWLVVQGYWRLLGGVVLTGLLALVLRPLYLGLLSPTSALRRLLDPDSSVAMSNAAREGHLRDSLSRFDAAPAFGSGFADPATAHDIYLQVATAAGIVGLAGFLLICGASLQGLWMPQLGPVRLLSLAPLVYLVAGVFSNNFWDRYVWFPIAVGLAFSLRRAPAPRPATPELQPA